MLRKISNVWVKYYVHILEHSHSFQHFSVHRRSFWSCRLFGRHSSGPRHIIPTAKLQYSVNSMDSGPLFLTYKMGSGCGAGPGGNVTKIPLFIVHYFASRASCWFRFRLSRRTALKIDIVDRAPLNYRHVILTTLLPHFKFDRSVRTIALRQMVVPFFTSRPRNRAPT